ncbi:MAG: pyridoxal 5'-phosphate synthase glutaminase subunit PdxT [Armatimonadetes bacterium]|nr:pyridoxal 5'-phosphate synthase glutaminase subunit PdxT [Armatimonadota bacterium]MDE2205806.1 pyridoxal 5'-phosphate synthase glutaminase subunit PdxT [Armatimonadota bacterium]
MSQHEASSLRVGVLALQGDYTLHIAMLHRLPGVSAAEVRTPGELNQVAALVIPGGESTTLGMLMNRIGLDCAITERAQRGMPLYGTCAGMILMARAIEGAPEQPTLNLLDIDVARNAFGRQLESFEAELPWTNAAGEPSHVHGVFIRAPWVTRTGEGVEVTSTYRGRVVGVRAGRMLATAFHPELTSVIRVHEEFVAMARHAAGQTV